MAVVSQDYITRIPTRPCRRHIHTYSTFSRIRSSVASFWTLERFLRQLKTTLRKVMEMVVRRRGCVCQCGAEERWEKGSEVHSVVAGPGWRKPGKLLCDIGQDRILVLSCSAPFFARPRPQPPAASTQTYLSVTSLGPRREDTRRDLDTDLTTSTLASAWPRWCGNISSQI